MHQGAVPSADAGVEENAMIVPLHHIVHPTADLLPDHALWSVNKDARATMKRIYAKWDAEMQAKIAAVDVASVENFTDDEANDDAGPAADDHTADDSPADDGEAGVSAAPSNSDDGNETAAANNNNTMGGAFSTLVQMFDNDPDELAQFNEQWKEARYRVLHAFDGIPDDMFLPEEQTLVNDIMDMTLRM